MSKVDLRTEPDRQPETLNIPARVTLPEFLFKHLTFHIIKSDELDESRANELRSILENNGAMGVRVSDNNVSIDFSTITHIITTNINFSDYEEADKRMIPVARPEWIEDSIKRDRVITIRPYSPDPKYFFSDIFISASGLPEPDKLALYAAVHAFGGQYMDSLTKFTTHVVAIDPNDRKCKMALFAVKRGIKVVLPHWIEDCIKLRKRVDETPYMFPEPPIIGSWDSENKIDLSDVSNDEVMKQLDSDIYDFPASDSSQIPSSSPPFFNGKRFSIDERLNLSSRSIIFLKQAIEYAGGSFVKSDVPLTPRRVDILITEYRDGKSYITASRNNLHVGNLEWLFYMLVHHTFSLATRYLLHYPRVRGPLKGMENNVISATNYTGDSRYYLSSLIEALGAKFTKPFRPINTHLICSRRFGMKYDAASQWDVVVVNHLWLEDSYAKWELQDVSHPRYAALPTTENTVEPIGETKLDLEVLKRFYEDEPMTDPVDVSIEIKENKKTPKLGSLQRLNINQKPLIKGNHRVAVKQIEKTPSNKENNEVINTSDQNNNKSSPYGPKVLPKTPLSIPTKRKQNTIETPSTISILNLTPTSGEEYHSTSRKAKDKAVRKLHEDMVDLNLYLKQSKLKNHNAPLLPIEIEQLQKIKQLESLNALTPSKRYKSSKHNSTDSDAVPGTSSPIRDDIATVSMPYVNIKAIITGYDTIISKSQLNHLTQFGITIINDISEANTLFAPRVCRTEKFLCSLRYGIDIISTSYLDIVLACFGYHYEETQEEMPIDASEVTKLYINSKMVDTLKLDNHKLEGDEQINISKSLDVSRNLIKQNKLLFSGLTFNITPQVNGGIDVVSRIMTTHGAKVCPIKSARTKHFQPCLELEHGEKRYIMISKPQDRRFIEMFKKTLYGDNKVEVYDWNWACGAILNMSLDVTTDEFVL